MNSPHIEPLQAEPAPPPVPAPLRALAVLNSICFYGMERNVVEAFDELRPSIGRCDVRAASAIRYHSPLLSELSLRSPTTAWRSGSWDYERSFGNATATP